MSLRIARAIDEASEDLVQEIGPPDLLVLLALAFRADDTGIAWPGKRRIAARTGLSRRTVQTSLARLRRRGIIVPLSNASGGRPGSTTLYRIDIAVLEKMTDGSSAFSRPEGSKNCLGGEQDMLPTGAGDA